MSSIKERPREKERKKTEKDIDRGIVYGKYKLEDMLKETVYPISFLV